MSEQKALLLTDVADSTRLAASMGDAATTSMWEAHDRLARDLLPAWRGREIDKTDGMLLLFDGAADALAYALAYQQALATLVPPLKARVGLHVGPVTLRANREADIARGAKPLEVDGAAKATTARVMSAALGGQILLTADARHSLNGEHLRVQSQGHWRLKGLPEPVELFEVGDTHASFTPPPDSDKAYRVVRQGDLWVPVREVRRNLPAERDAFVGRARELAELAERFHSGARLVSVLGIGGCGKSRLATRFGWTWLGEFPGGVWFCDLTSVHNLSGIVHAVASALDVPLGKEDPVVQLGHAISARGPCLLIFDNFEQVARHSQDTLGHWLDRAGEARFVVTTREVLGLAGEEILALPPLPPSEGEALFVRRANAVRADVPPAADDDTAIAQLVRLLDGLPLAIELAAARSRLMPPRTLLARMSDRFKVLRSAGGRQDRQATLRAAFDWSWDLLSMSEKAALAQLSVFEGGFTLEAAESVLDIASQGDGPWPTDVVQSLVDKSLTRHISDTRFGLLVSMQEYAAEHLRTEGRFPGSGPLALQAAQTRHGIHYASLGKLRAAEAFADLDNLVVACRRAVARGDAESATGALEGAWALLLLRGPFQMGIDLAESICTMPGLPQRLAAHALAILATAHWACGRLGPAQAHYEDALARSRAAGDRLCEAEVIGGLGWWCLSKGRIDDARTEFVALLGMAREMGEQRLECQAHNGLGYVELNKGKVDAALSQYERALSLAREAGLRRVQGDVLDSLGHLFAEVGRLDEARELDEEALAIARETGNRALEAHSISNLGLLHLLQGRLRESIEASEAALTRARELGDVWLECTCLCNLGTVLEQSAHPDEAQAKFETAVRIANGLGDARLEGQVQGYLGLLHARRGRLDVARRCLDAGEALLRAATDGFGLGVMLCGRAEASLLAGDTTAARACLADAEEQARDSGAQPTSSIGLALLRVRALIAGSPS
ncbi:MAG: tetratricopeptide repeat protein [Planctomycetota bacterium]